MIAGRLEAGRFAFGANWAAFVASLTPAQEAAAQKSLQALVGEPALAGLSFLDVGSGSGLSSLSAFRLGASRVCSFDYDPKSVRCTEWIRATRAPSAVHWSVQQGSVLDPAFLESLGAFDVVYSWGVLHHTGQMWRAIDEASQRVRPGGRFIVAIYNDQGLQSHVWWLIKRIYVAAPAVVQFLIAVSVASLFEIGRFFTWTLKCQFYWPPAYWSNYRNLRGMSVWRDVIDWVGGFPFEVATPESLRKFLAARGFTEITFIEVGGKLGCNQFVFRRGYR